MEDAQPRRDPPVLKLVDPGETVHAVAEAADEHLLLTDRRLLVASGERVALDVPVSGLRRIQFDIERNRPATLVIVPMDPTHDPQVLAVPRKHYDEVTAALAEIGRRLPDTEEAS
jgi:hypothetical protein